MSETATTYWGARSKAHVPGEIEARHLIFVGVKPDDVAQISGVTPKVARGYMKDIAEFGHGPYSIETCALMLGVSYRAIHRAIQDGELSAKLVDGENYQITLASLKALAESRLKKYGLRKATFLLFAGKSPRIAAIRGRITEQQAENLLAQMKADGVGPKSEGPYSIVQVSSIIGLHIRQIRVYCQTGRLGKKYGYQYLVSKEELLRFGAKDRRTGCAEAA